MEIIPLTGLVIEFRDRARGGAAERILGGPIGKAPRDHPDIHGGAARAEVRAPFSNLVKRPAVLAREKPNRAKRRHTRCVCRGVDVARALESADRAGGASGAGHHTTAATPATHRAPTTRRRPAPAAPTANCAGAGIADGDRERHGGGGIERQHDGRQCLGRHGRQGDQAQLSGHGQSRRWDRCRRGNRCGPC